MCLCNYVVRFRVEVQLVGSSAYCQKGCGGVFEEQARTRKHSWSIPGCIRRFKQQACLIGAHSKAPTPSKRGLVSP